MKRERPEIGPATGAERTADTGHGHIPTVVIIGGGLCGATTAWHLVRKTAPGSVKISIIEPRAKLGGGLAYSTPDPAHRINVPAAKMSMDAGDLAHFARWLADTQALKDDPAAIGASGDAFPRRQVFGQYVADQLEPYLASGQIEHIHSRADAVELVAGNYLIRLSNGSYLPADRLVIATSHPRPGLPAQFRPLAQSARLVAHLYDPQSLAGLGLTDRVLIVGSGLTSADAIASLDAMGHTGPILALSRHGYRSAEHGPAQAATSADFAADPATTAGGLLRRIRAALAVDAAAGLTWHAALDKCRTQGAAIWAALPQPERARLVRHLRAAWDVHRFRIAPQPAAVINRRIAAGSLSYVAARLIDAEETPGGIAVQFRPRGACQTIAQTFDRVIITTGPAHGAIVASNPVLASLARLGLVQADPLGLGIAVDPQSRTIGPDVAAGQGILVSGPLARARFGELMGVPEVTGHAEFIADQLVQELALAIV